MIQRRRPIESAIAERKMFNMGGMAVPMPQPTYMDLTQQGIMGMPQQPMGMPQQAQGIMASSQPLVDAIAADAANPAGGDTLSMAQGGLASEDLMARGYRNGGINYGQNPDRPAKALGSSMFKREYPFPEGYAPFGDKIVPIEGVGGLGKSWSGESSEPSTTLVGSLINNSGPNYSTGSSRGPSLSTINLLSKDINDQYVFDNEKLDLAVPVINSAEGKIKSISINSLLSENPSETYERWMSSPSLDTDRKASESRAGMLRRVGAGIATDTLRGLATEVKNVWSSVFDAEFANQYPDFDGGALATAVAQMQEQHPDLAGEILERSTALIRNNPEVGVMDFKKSIIKALSNKYELSPHTKIIDNAASEEAAFREIGLGDETTALTSEEEAQAEFNRTVADETTALTSEEEAALSAAKSERYAPLPPTRPGAGPAEAAGTSPSDGGSQGLNEVIGGFNTAANQAASILDTDKKADGKTIEDFKKQFMEAMPKYEGMSEDEKGFLIAEAGLRIMAGKSPNAIENIAKGLQGLGPALMKGAKEERAWKRQVELSAAKYALEGTARADAKADALAKEGRVRKQFIVGKTFTDLSGVKREKGSLYTPTAAEMGTDSFQRNILPNLTTEGIYKERLDNAGALTGIVRVGAKHGPSAEGVTKALDAYTDLTKDVRNNAKMLTMLDASIVQNAKGEVTGFAPWASKKINQLKNATGYKKQIKILDGIDTSTGQGLERFQYQQQVIANMMLKEILGEGSKNVSNIDRTLASEIVGLLKGFSSIYADPAVLHQKLQGIRGVVQQGLRGSLTKMRNSEVGFGNTYTAFAPGSPGLNVSDQMAEQRRSLLGDIQGVGQRTQSRSEAAGRAPVVLKASDYFDFDKMTIRKNLP